jgi:hypothetical protein
MIPGGLYGKRHFGDGLHLNQARKSSRAKTKDGPLGWPAGKPEKVVLMACVRKLFSVLGAILGHCTPCWRSPRNLTP